MAAGGALACYLGYRLYERRAGRQPEPPRPREARAAAERRPAGAGEPSPAQGLLPIPVAAAAKETIAESRSDLEDLDLYATSREQRFRIFASLEFEGQLYMTPYDFIQSVTSDAPKRAKKWRSLSKQDAVFAAEATEKDPCGVKRTSTSVLISSSQELNQILIETPPVWKGSSKLFRNLREKGLISYTEYLFLLCILTKPHAGFKIAFNMFDTDGNEMVDKKEFLVLQEIFRKKNEKRERKGDEEKRIMLRLQLYGYHSSTNSRADDISSLLSDTTLLVHFFGKKGKAELNFDDFYRFMDNLQTEVLEIEFLSYSNGMNTISEEDFAHILLRYTNVENTSSYLENVHCRIPEEKGITFDEFRSFFQFLNNLEDFAIAMQMYNFANRSIGQDEFKRAVYVATGLKLSAHLVNTVFKIFDVDRDDQLSYKEFIGIMKDRLNRGFRETPKYGLKGYYVCVTTVTSKHLRELWKQFRSRDMLR
ncbi:calcium uptake protein 3, mitochondrial isoform X4 [Gopherus flavomarginatus]|uniref:calcium uptake protein 3, mitochondrial isoform X4 n=1 Tax=Gopherus flavomarginatus TaxID=286002 RepID=UPI0021CBDDB7|nr:calcium uptake protein 3, mitochondrial isoform X4 [Gopherus flavomarginatus]